MIEESKFKEFIELTIANFNSKTYEFFMSNMTEDAELICPEVNSLLAKTPKMHCKGKEKIIKFWKNLSKITDPTVSHIEYLEYEEVQRARFHYHQIDLVMDAALHFNEDEQLSKLVFTIVS